MIYKYIHSLSRVRGFQIKSHPSGGPDHRCTVTDWHRDGRRARPGGLGCPARCQRQQCQGKSRHLESWFRTTWMKNWESLFCQFWYIQVYTGIYQTAESQLWYEEVWTVYFHPCCSQCDVDFLGWSLHAYIPMKDTSCTAVILTHI